MRCRPGDGTECRWRRIEDRPKGNRDVRSDGARPGCSRRTGTGEGNQLTGCRRATHHADRHVRRSRDGYHGDADCGHGGHRRQRRAGNDPRSCRRAGRCAGGEGASREPDVRAVVRRARRRRRSDRRTGTPTDARVGVVEAVRSRASGGGRSSGCLRWPAWRSAEEATATSLPRSVYRRSTGWVQSVAALTPITSSCSSTRWSIGPGCCRRSCRG